MKRSISPLNAVRGALPRVESGIAPGERERSMPACRHVHELRAAKRKVSDIQLSRS